MLDHRDPVADRLVAQLTEQYEDLLPAGLVRSVVVQAVVDDAQDEQDGRSGASAAQADVAALAAAVLRSRQAA